jgi:deoxyribonuclease-1-like protein
VSSASHLRRGGLVAFFAAMLAVAGCDGFLGDRGDKAPPAAAGETVTVASFNIQVFGTSKASDERVMDVLAKVVQRFDVVAIQEIRSKDQSLMDDFLRRINAGGGHYRYVIGPRLGRTTSKEQYAFIYNAATIELIAGSVYTVNDPDDRLHREPLVARFRVRGPPAAEAFTFSLVNIHTDPDETDDELNALADVFRAVQNNGSGEDDVILLGDLNEGPWKYGRLGELPNIRWAISDRKTNTRQTKSYDNLLFDGSATKEYTGHSGVLNLMTEFQLSLDDALKVSDHMPVWAAFSAREAGRAPVAAGAAGGAVRR